MAAKKMSLALLTMGFLVVLSILHGHRFGLYSSSLSSPEGLFETLPPTPAIMTDSTNATVMGFSTNYDKGTYQRFVGSLRNSGFKGHIILGVSSDINPDAEAYLQSRNVIMKKLEFIPCTHSFGNAKDGNQHANEVRTCVSPYPLLKHRWGRFPKLRDFLLECATCTGPVLVTDVRDTYFQRDPFGDGQPEVEGLQVFTEHKSITTQHWVADGPIRACKNITLEHPMLCSGTTIGTRQAMLNYLEVMHGEMKMWMADPKCHFDRNGDDQSIHNYLYWTGKLPFAKAIPNRQGIVHTIGAQGAILMKVHKKFTDEMSKAGASEELIREYAPFREVSPHQVEKDDPKRFQWMRLEYDLIDEEGFILNYDATRSSLVHQYDRLGGPFGSWLNHWSGLVDRD